MNQYVIVYAKTLILENGTVFTKMIGPFATLKAAQDYYAANTPDEASEIDVIYTPN
jgi:hypothetical protein